LTCSHEEQGGQASCPHLRPLPCILPGPRAGTDCGMACGHFQICALGSSARCCCLYSYGQAVHIPTLTLTQNLFSGFSQSLPVSKWGLLFRKGCVGS
jgi:hypothetical protein